MWLFKLFSRDKAKSALTASDVRDELQLELGSQYQTYLTGNCVIVDRDDSPVAYIELVENNSKAVLFYETTLRPFFAGDITLALSAILPTSLGDSEFTSERAAESPEGCH